jgi:hypothetical protein
MPIRGFGFASRATTIYQHTVDPLPIHVPGRPIKPCGCFNTVYKLDSNASLGRELRPGDRILHASGLGRKQQMLEDSTVWRTLMPSVPPKSMSD